MDTHIVSKACSLRSERTPRRRITWVSYYNYMHNLPLLIRPISLELPKVLHEALDKLTMKDKVQTIDSLIHVSLENITSNHTEPLDLALDEHLDINDWREGVEELNDCTEDQLWQLLGLSDKHLPFFQEWTDPDTQISLWSTEGRKWLEDPASPHRQLRPRWHQLISIFCMLERTFEGKPVLLMDSIRLSKTLQVLGAIACIAWYREYYNHNHTYPGHFGESSLLSSFNGTVSHENCSRSHIQRAGGEHSQSPSHHCLPGQSEGPVAMQNGMILNPILVQHSFLHWQVQELIQLVDSTIWTQCPASASVNNPCDCICTSHVVIFSFISSISSIPIKGYWRQCNKHLPCQIESGRRQSRPECSLWGQVPQDSLWPHLCILRHGQNTICLQAQPCTLGGLCDSQTSHNHVCYDRNARHNQTPSNNHLTWLHSLHFTNPLLATGLVHHGSTPQHRLLLRLRRIPDAEPWCQPCNMSQQSGAAQCRRQRLDPVRRPHWFTQPCHPWARILKHNARVDG